MRLEALESMVHRIADELDEDPFGDYPQKPYQLFQEQVPLKQKIEVGQHVLHAKFGTGEVVAIEGHGPEARAQINFKRTGVKWLALAFAKLEVLPI